MQIGENGSIEQEEEAAIIAVRTYLLANYKPAFNPAEAELHFSTNEIWQKMLKVYPNELLLRPSMIADWLASAGFKIFEYGDLNFEWMMNKHHSTI